MTLVTVIFESQANTRLICLQPYAVVAGEELSRTLDILDLSPPGEQRGLKEGLCEDGWDFFLSFLYSLPPDSVIILSDVKILS